MRSKINKLITLIKSNKKKSIAGLTLVGIMIISIVACLLYNKFFIYDLKDYTPVGAFFEDDMTTSLTIKDYQSFVIGYGKGYAPFVGFKFEDEDGNVSDSDFSEFLNTLYDHHVSVKYYNYKMDTLCYKVIDNDPTLKKTEVSVSVQNHELDIVANIFMGGATSPAPLDIENGNVDDLPQKEFLGNIVIDCFTGRTSLTSDSSADTSRYLLVALYNGDNKIAIPDNLQKYEDFLKENLSKSIGAAFDPDYVYAHEDEFTNNSTDSSNYNDTGDPVDDSEFIELPNELEDGDQNDN